MQELTPGLGLNRPEFSVSELSRALKRTLEDAYGLVRVRGEVGRVHRHSSGHLYLTLKDAEAVIESVAWRGSVPRLSVIPEAGMEVVCTGRISTFMGKSQYQLIIEQVELAGVGALLKLIEERKKRLEAEGLFAPERKKKLPFLPETIGVVTSPTGAVIRDILHRLADRFPRRVLIWPVAVQGEAAAAQIAAAIRGFNTLEVGGAVPRPDVLIVARGGGSVEDLMPFNEEAVVRAAAESKIPLISAIGHETDVTLIDFAADLRAPTPTAAAEFAVPVRAELVRMVAVFGARLAQALERNAAEKGQRFDAAAERLLFAGSRALELARHRLAQLDAALPRPDQQVARARLALAAETRALRSALVHFVAARRARFDATQVRIRPNVLQDRLTEGRGDASEMVRRLNRAIQALARNWLERLARTGDLLESYSHQSVLARGFALVRNSAGQPLFAAADTRPGMGIAIEFQDGSVGATVDGKGVSSASKPSADRPVRAKPKGQGSLF
jgi:exodeoxyribonuclease VII large subunit